MALPRSELERMHAAGTDTLGPVVAAVADVTVPPSARRRSWGAIVAVGLSALWITVVVVAAIGADWLPIASPSRVRPVDRLQGPSWAHPFGTDNLGRDLFSRAIYGSRVSLVVGVVSVLIGLVIGGAIGVTAGYLRGRVDAVVSWVMDVLLSFPSLVLLIALVAFTGGGLRNICLALGFLAIPIYARLARAHALSVAGEEFVLAARAGGSSRMRVLWREIVPNILPTLTAYGLVSMSLAIVVEGSLSFLGLSVSTPTPSWGGLIASGQGFIRQAWTWVVFPAVVLCLTVLSLNVSGERLRRRFEVGAGG
ncbi:MAG: dipeptide transporter [Ilumatobacteraceae bacterium]|nr:dipeptide transporter [Ilumatobacteraceae bacterium]